MAELTLGPLSEKDTAKLLQRGKEYFLPQDYHFMKNVAAGHPYLLQVVASALWETYEDEEDDPTQRRQLAGEQLHQEITPTLNDIWRLWTPEMRKTFTTIALDHTPTLLGHRKFNSVPFLKSLGDKLTVTLSRMALSGTPRRVSSRLSSIINEIASVKLFLH